MPKLDCAWHTHTHTHTHAYIIAPPATLIPRALPFQCQPNPPLDTNWYATYGIAVRYFDLSLHCLYVYMYWSCVLAFDHLNHACIFSDRAAWPSACHPGGGDAEERPCLRWWVSSRTSWKLCWLSRCDRHRRITTEFHRQRSRYCRVVSCWGVFLRCGCAHVDEWLCVWVTAYILCVAATGFSKTLRESQRFFRARH